MMRQFRGFRWTLLAVFLCVCGRRGLGDDIQWRWEYKSDYTVAGYREVVHGIWGSAADDVFAVGGGGLILHYDGTAWVRMTSGTSRDLYDVWGSGASHVIAVGAEGTVLRYDGANWTPISGLSALSNALSVWGTSPTDFLVGSSQGYIHHYDGSAWSVSNWAQGGVNDLWGRSSTEVYAVHSGVVQANGGETPSWIARFDGNEWTGVRSSYYSLSGITGASDGSLYAVGAYGTILAYEGTSWVTTYVDQHLGAVWAAGPGDVFAVGSEGRILHYRDGTWTRMTSGTSVDLPAVWGSSASDVWAGGRWGCLFHHKPGDRTLDGVWGATSISGDGTYDLFTRKPDSGTILITVAATGDITGNFNYVATYHAATDRWYGTSAEITGTVNVEGTPHPAKLWLKGDILNFEFTDFESHPPFGLIPTAWRCDVHADLGVTHGYTTDGSNLSADFGWDGSCAGPVSVWLGTWTVPGGTGAGSWEGVASECLGGKTEFAGSGYGVVSLAASPLAASLEFDFGANAYLLLTKLKANPGVNPERAVLHKYIQVDSSVTTPDIDWDEVTLQIHYYDEELAVSGMDEESLSMYRLEGSNWVEMALGGVNAEINFVWAALDQFGIYCVQGDSTFFTCDGEGTPQSEFGNGQSVYVSGRGLGFEQSYRLWVQTDEVADGDLLQPDDDPTGAQELVSSDAQGTLAVTSVGRLALSAQGGYRIVADRIGWQSVAGRLDEVADQVGDVMVTARPTILKVR